MVNRASTKPTAGLAALTGSYDKFSLDLGPKSR